MPNIFIYFYETHEALTEQLVQCYCLLMWLV